MAEWIGRRRSGPDEASPQTVPEKIDLSPAPLAPPAPGAVASPQMPGMVPDRSSVPGHHSVVVPPAERPVRRPLTEYGTAQRIMRMYQAAPGEEMNPKRFESVPVSDEEIRKINPDLGRPVRPLPGYALGRGAAAASLEAFEASEAGETAALPAPTGLSPSTATIATDARFVAPGAPTPAAPPAASAPSSANTPMATPPETASSGAAGPSSQPLPGTESPAARALGAASPNVVAGEQAGPPASVEADAAPSGTPTSGPVGQGKAATLAAAAARFGALRGTGSHDCPASHPIKGNAQSGIYHTRESASYNRTIPEFCFRAAADAEAAGFRAPR